MELLSDLQVAALICERLELKQQRKFTEADVIRNQLEFHGITLRDVKGTTEWKRAPIEDDRIIIRDFGEAFERDYEFYLANCDKYNFSGSLPEVFEENEQGYDAKTCFYVYETRGVKLPCKEIQILNSVLLCKGSINFHLKMWAEGFYDMCEPKSYYQEILKDAPDWCYSSFLNQLAKINYPTEVDVIKEKKRPEVNFQNSSGIWIYKKVD